jgi:hypothetical protein
MQVKQINTPLHTPLVTLIMQYDMVQQTVTINTLPQNLRV